MYDVEKMIRIRKGVEEISGVDDTYRELISFCKSRKRIFLFGTEQFGMYFYELLRKQGIVPHGFIDIDPNKTAIDQHKFPVLFRHFEEIDFKNEASEIGVIISCPRDLHGLAVRRLPNEVELFHTTDDAIKVLYEKEILCDALAKTEETSFAYMNAPVEEKWNHFRNTFYMIHDGEMFEKNLLISDWHGRDDIRGISIDDVGIVIQGPIYEDGNFTLETCKFYRSLYPNIPIVISTWRGGVDDEFARQCQAIGVIVIANEMPQGPDFQHVVLQMTSSIIGINLITTHFKNVKYVLKQRTDQRLNMSDFLLYFKNLLRVYPPTDDKLEARLAFLSCSIWDPFYICDYMAFGTVNDMKKLYGARDPKVQEAADFSLTAEFYIYRTFHKMYIGPIPHGSEVGVYFNFLKNYAVISGIASLKLEWPKYLFDRHKLLCFGTFMDHAKWLNYCYCENPGVRLQCIASEAKTIVDGTKINIQL